MGGEVCESLFAMAQPAGPTVRAVYEGFRREILDDLKKSLPVDMVLLSLHGAMVVDGLEDAEGRLVEDVRRLTGPDIPIGIELDSHGHLSDRMVENASLVIVYKEYPHTDMEDRAGELFDLCHQIHKGSITPALSVHDCQMIGIWPTSTPLMRRFIDKMKNFEEQDNILSVSFIHSFPWADVSYMGAKILVVSNDDKAAGNLIAADLARDIWDIRTQTGIPHKSIAEALELAQKASHHPVIMADVSDNPGGGAPGDSTFLLSAILDAGLVNVAFSSLWDPAVVEQCRASGVGATIKVELGGKCGPASGPALDLRVGIKAIVENACQSLNGLTLQMGNCVWLNCAGIDILVNDIRTQTLGLDAFTQMGIDPRRYNTVVVKSMHHFHAAFAPIAAEVIYVSSPGALNLEFSQIPYQNLTAPRWPRDDITR